MTQTAELKTNPTLKKLADALDQIAAVIGDAKPLGINFSSVGNRCVSVQLPYHDFASIFAGRTVNRQSDSTHDHLHLVESGIYFTTCHQIAGVTKQVMCPEAESVGGEP